MMRLLRVAVSLSLGWAFCLPGFAVEPSPARPAVSRKLGCIPTPPRLQATAPRLSRYLLASLPPPPPTCDWCKAKFKMFGNGPDSEVKGHADGVGDCTCAGAANMRVGQSTADGHPVLLTGQQVVDFYFGLSHGRDTGLDLVTVLQAAQKQGLWGVKWGPYCRVNPASVEEVKQAIYLFGGVYIGISLPTDWADQTDAWTVHGAKTRPEGGHCVILMGYDQDHFQVITWAIKVPMECKALHMVCFDAYCVVSPDWWDGPDQRTPSGFDLQTLNAELQAMGQPVMPAKRGRPKKSAQLSQPHYSQAG